MKKKIKLRYVDTMSKDYKNAVLWQLLTKWYDIDDISEPDYVMSGGNGAAFTKYRDCVLIQLIGENIVPDFNVFDYAIGFDHIEFDDRYVRIPLFFFYECYSDVVNINKNIERPMATDRKFCSFVVSNAHANPIRDEFFKRLCEYKKVDSAGRHLNNVGGGFLQDKLGFVANYKFNIAFENCSSRGYTTEKIMEPMAVCSLPIYWGNPSVNEDFNPKAFINVNEFETVDKCVDYIRLLDNNDDLYLEKLAEPWIIKENLVDYEAKLKAFFDNIFNQDIKNCHRVNAYGRQPVLRNKLIKFYGYLDLPSKFNAFFNNVKSLL